MKVDPNQFVGGVIDPEAGRCSPDAEHVGGIPLRLWMAAKVLASEDCSRMDHECASRHALERTDALIAAHNATCEAGEVAGG